MGVLKNVLLEDLNRICDMKASFQNRLSSLPKGSIQKKRINNNCYYYLVFRDENGKYMSQYLGKEGSDKLIEFQQLIKIRKSHEVQLAKVLEEERDLRKAIRVLK